MQAILKRSLLETTVFDSGALGLTTSVIHQFAQPGVYRATVSRGGRPVGEAAFEVRDDATAMQLDIDLATAAANGGDDDCGCAGKRSAPPAVSSKGYVLFHASSGDGWSVLVGEAKKPTFDSQKLGKGDLFALLLMEPADYGVENTVNGAKASIAVSFTRNDAKRIGSLPTVMVRAGETFRPAGIKLVATQGLVFEVEQDARIVVRREGEREKEPERGPMRFERPRMAEQPRRAGRRG